MGGRKLRSAAIVEPPIVKIDARRSSESPDPERDGAEEKEEER
jgi:hypothetical protein